MHFVKERRINNFILHIQRLGEELKWIAQGQLKAGVWQRGRVQIWYPNQFQQTSWEFGFSAGRIKQNCLLISTTSSICKRDCVCMPGTHMCSHMLSMKCIFFLIQTTFWNLGIFSLSHSSSAPAHWKGLDSISSHSCVIITTVRRFWIINALLYQLKTFSFCSDTDSSIKPHGMLTSHLSDVAHWHLQCREK